MIVTVADFRAVPGVVEVRDCDPGPGHVTLVVERLGVVAAIADDVPLNLLVHEELAGA